MTAEPKKGFWSTVWRWIRERATKAAEKAAENFFLLIIVAVVSAGGTIVAFLKNALHQRWLLITVGALVFAISIGGIVLAIIRKVRTERCRLQEQIDALEEQMQATEQELTQERRGSEAVRTLLYNMLEAVQEEVAHEQAWEMDDLVERGVLGAVRGLLTRSPEEDVRLAVLVPREGNQRWRMRWAAGHSLQGVRNYDREIDKTIAGKAYREGNFLASNNVKDDPRFEFEPNPRATREYVSQMVVPLRIGSEVVGVFSVVSTIENAFSETNQSFIKVVGAVLDIILAMERDAKRAIDAIQRALDTSPGESKSA